DQIISSRDHFKTLYERPAARRKHRSALITLCATKRLNIRPFRHEPRAVKRRPKGYQLLSEPRHTFQEIHHRSEYRKTTQVSAIRLRNFFVCLSGENFALSFESRMPEPLLELKNVTVVRGGRAVLENFSFRFAKGERLAILGRNGSGKSTLLSILTGELHIAFRPESSIQLFGKKRWRLEDLRGQIGFVIPEQTAQFSPRERASDVVLSSFQKAYGVTRMMTFEDDEREATHHAIARAGVAHLADRPFGELSSGEKRRFLLARALVHDPELLVLDEPTTALDLPGAWSYLRTIGELCREGRSLIFVTHDAREIPKEVERVLLLKDGEILADGAKEHILTEPQLSECYGLPVSVTWQDGHCQVQPAAGD
ncbi:MAG: ATP-binding cassette domain-containing protein, partial [Verrucomicrobiota bacterium JB023]|nr:ATP-binding cassette domain-containing protein [Verrucomicrobiota bacterium JB023]